MQLAATPGARLASVHDLHSPAMIHAPPAPPARLRVGIAAPFDPNASGHGLRVTSLTLRPDGTTGDDHADAALRTASIVDRALAERFGRDGVDGRGGSVELVVHAPDASNAYWDKQAGRIELGDGDGTRWGSFASSLSVMAHELYHGVIDAEVNLDYEVPEQAAIHESLADVFAAGMVGSWRIGDDVVTPTVAGDAIRDLQHPGVAHMDVIAKAGGESHALSGVASLAAVRSAERIGGDAMQRIWYAALVGHLPDGARFTDVARATIEAASKLHGAGSAQQLAVSQAWESVGVIAR